MNKDIQNPQIDLQKEFNNSQIFPFWNIVLSKQNTEIFLSNVPSREIQCQDKLREFAISKIDENNFKLFTKIVKQQ